MPQQNPTQISPELALTRFVIIALLVTLSYWGAEALDPVFWVGVYFFGACLISNAFELRSAIRTWNLRNELYNEAHQNTRQHDSYTRSEQRLSDGWE